MFLSLSSSGDDSPARFCHKSNYRYVAQVVVGRAVKFDFYRTSQLLLFFFT